ncbi:hypothetical protein OROMI_019167 [Orobanche minor]
MEIDLLIVVLALAYSSSFVSPDAQGEALYALRTSINASSNQLTDWYRTQVNPCTWSKVRCDSNNNVISVILPNMGFSGTLSPRIGNLTMLMTLDLQGNGLSGVIPEEFGNMTSLSMLDLGNNKLTGEIPSSLGSLKRLTFLILSRNNLSGPIPESLSSLPDLADLNLQGNGLSGVIPEEFGNMTSLSTLDLDNNKLTGEIPSSLGRLKRLMFLSLSRNNLSGSIPESLSSLPDLADLQLASNNLSGDIPEQLFRISKHNFTVNQLNCGVKPFPPCASVDAGRKSKPKTSMIVGIAFSLLAILFLGSYLMLILWKGAEKSYKGEIYIDVEGEADRRLEFGQLKRFSWGELQFATNNFDEGNVLGQGGFGKVYKGVLADNTKVAVKRLTDFKSPGGDIAFQREVEMISVAIHRNLLRLIGFCTTPAERLLVYPFMPNLSVASRLRVHLKPGEPVLDWPTRKRVALGTARGLEYLHEQCNPKIIHRDVKAANVLLDEGFEAVVGDFGLAKLVDVRKTDVTTQVRGTMGHIAPEYLSTGKSSEKTDVFGFGIMLLELVTGQRAIDFARLEEEDDVLLLDHVKKLQSVERLDAILDPNLHKDHNIIEVEIMIQVALLCTQPSPEDRPRMSEVVRMLAGEGLTERWEMWQHTEVTRRVEYERLQRRIDWGQDSIGIQDAVELSGGR